MVIGRSMAKTLMRPRLRLAASAPDERLVAITLWMVLVWEWEAFYSAYEETPW